MSQIDPEETFAALFSPPQRCRSDSQPCTDRQQSRRLRRSARPQTVEATTSGACAHAIGRQPQRAPDAAALHTTSATVPSEPPCTASCSSMWRASLPTPRPAPDRSCRAHQGRVRRLPQVLHPGARVPQAALRGVQPRQAAGVQQQAPRVLRVVRCSAHVADRGVPCGSLHSAGAGTAMGAVPVDPAARAAGRAGRSRAICRTLPSARPWRARAAPSR